MTALFIRALDAGDKAAALAGAAQAATTGALNARTFSADPSSFRQVPNAPFAYWISERIRRLFAELPPFESEGRTARQGLATADDFRFVRAWWEVDPRRIGSKWHPFAKGGEYSPYYADLHLVVNWEDDGREIRSFMDPKTGRVFSRPQSTDSYFRPGLTWSRRTQGGFSMRALPAGAVFADKGPAVLCESVSDLNALLGLANSLAFRGLLDSQMAFGSFEVGVVQRTPVPRSLTGHLAEETGETVACRRRAATVVETNHLFTRPRQAGTSSEDGDWLMHHAEVENLSTVAYGLSASDLAQFALPSVSELIGNLPLDEEDGEE